MTNELLPLQRRQLGRRRGIAAHFDISETVGAVLFPGTAYFSTFTFIAGEGLAQDPMDPAWGFGHG